MLLKIIFIDSLTKNKGWVDFKYLKCFYVSKSITNWKPIAD